jgi:hypothetical protein
MAAAAVTFAGGVWWHWTQFGVDYRTSTWQEQLRNYASYVILLVVVLMSYAFYVFVWDGGSLQSYAARAQTAVRDAGRKASSQLIGSTTRGISAMSNTLFSSSSSPPMPSSNAARPLNYNRNRGFTGEPAYLD